MVAGRHEEINSHLQNQTLTWLARKPEGTERMGPMRGAMLLSRSSTSLLCSVLCPPCRVCMPVAAATCVNAQSKAAIVAAVECGGNRSLVHQL